MRIRAWLTAALAATVALSGVAASSANAAIPGDSNDGVRIMPLGDSITEGYDIPGGYRTKLFQTLTASGKTIDMVGTGTYGTAQLADKDHEGHSGWRIDQLDANIGHWLFASDPRTVLLQIGTNDVNQNYYLSSAPARLAGLIDHILQYKPNVQLFVATITPQTNGREQQVQAYNASIPGIVSARGPNVHLLDMHSVVTGADLSDGTHPTQTGFDKMGVAWSQALNAYPASLQALPPAPPAPIGSTISLQASNGMYVSAWQPHNNALEALVNHVAGWEKFQVVDAGHGLIGLRALGNGNYVSALQTQEAPLVANVAHLSGWEMFRWIDVGNNNVVLVAATNSLFVSTRTDIANTPLRADASLASTNQVLHWAIAP